MIKKPQQRNTSILASGFPEELATVVHRGPRGSPSECVLVHSVVSEPGVRAIHIDERDGTLDGGSLPVERGDVELILHGVWWERDGHRHGREGVYMDGLESGVLGVAHVSSQRPRGWDRSLSRRAERGSDQSQRVDPR